MKISPSIFTNNIPEVPSKVPLIVDSLLKINEGLRRGLSNHLTARLGQHYYDHDNRVLDQKFERALTRVIELRTKNIRIEVERLIQDAWCGADCDLEHILLEDGKNEQRSSQEEYDSERNSSNNT